MAGNLDWLWISAVVLVSLFILVLCWTFFRNYTCCPCRQTREPDDVEASRSYSRSSSHSTSESVSFQSATETPRSGSSIFAGWIPPTRPQPQQYRADLIPSTRVQPSRIPNAQPPLAELHLAPTVFPHAVPKVHYNFNGIVNAKEAVKMRGGIPELDLHELRVKEAIQVTRLFLNQSRGHYRRVHVITGRGLHSPGGIPRIKPKIVDLLDDNNYTYREMFRGGCLDVTL